MAQPIITFSPNFPTFAGTAEDNFAVWEGQVESYLPFIHASAHDAAIFSLLRGAAANIGLTYIRTPPEERHGTSFLAYLGSKFQRQEDPYVIRNRLANLGQTGSVADYVTAFSAIADRVFPRSEVDLIFHFVRGLRSSTVQSIVLQSRPKTLGEAILCATQMENSRTAISPKTQGTAMDLDAVELKAEQEEQEEHLYAGQVIRGRKPQLPSPPPRRRGNGDRPPYPCRYCGGDHWNKECPKRTSQKGSFTNKNTRYSSYPNAREALATGAATTTASLLILEVTLLPNNKARALIDSGASANFILSSFVKRHQLRTERAEALKLILANGTHEAVSRIHTGQLSYNDTNLNTILYVLPSEQPRHFDIILGMPWLQAANPNIIWNQLAIASASAPKISDTCLSEVFITSVDVVKEQDELILCHISSEDSESNPDAIRDSYIKSFPTVFDSDVKQLPAHRDGMDHAIQLIDENVKPCLPLYRLSPLEQGELKRTIDDLLAKGFIRPSHSPFGSPVIFVKKKNGSFRMCVDYRRLNANTVKSSYPIPRVDESLDRLAGARIFSQLDLTSGYHQVRIKAGDEPKTAFRTRHGTFEYTVVPFGLCNAPSTFANFMNSVLAPFLDTFVIVYLDDILIFSRSEEEHREHVQLVLQTLRKHGLIANPKKCRFHQRSIEFLGYTVSDQGIHTSPDKIQAIRSWPTPNSVSSLRRFLGLTNFYRRFVKQYVSIAQPLYSLLVKDAVWEWNEERSLAFDRLKTALIEAPLLAHPNPSRPFILTTDASSTAVGGVLSQASTDGERPIAFESFPIPISLRNKPPYQQELYAIYHCCVTKWRCFLEGAKHPVIVRTDHKALVHTLQARTHPCRKMAGWIQELTSRFNLEITYLPGEDNTVADALSRLHEPDQIIQVSAVLPDVVIETASPWESEIRDKLNNRSCYKFNQGQLLTRRQNQWKIVPRVANRFNLIAQTHSANGHRSAAATYQQLKDKYWWPEMKHLCQRLIDSCPSCLAHSHAHPQPTTLLQRTVLPVFARWGCDAIGPLEETEDGNKYILTAVDATSKLAFTRAVPNIDAQITLAFYQDLFALFGTPLELVTDRGSNFMAHTVTEFLSGLNIRHTPTTPYNPRSNGACERLNGTLGTALKRIIAEKGSAWDRELWRATKGYNEAQHSAIAVSPHALAFGLTEPVTEAARIQAQELMDTKIRARNEKLNTVALTNPLEAGDLVLWLAPSSGKLQPDWRGPFTVVSPRPFETADIQLENRIARMHRSRLLKIPEKDIYQRWKNFFTEGGNVIPQYD